MSFINGLPEWEAAQWHVMDCRVPRNAALVHIREADFIMGSFYLEWLYKRAFFPHDCWETENKGQDS